MASGHLSIVIGCPSSSILFLLGVDLRYKDGICAQLTIPQEEPSYILSLCCSLFLLMASQNTDAVDNTHMAFRDCELVSFRGEALPREAETAQVPSKHGASVVALDI